MTHYALTSAHSWEYADPGNWRLLGSTNRGLTWVVLDVQTNQDFGARCQRRLYTMRNRQAYSTYRLEVTNVSNVQLAELELLGPTVGSTNGADLPFQVSSSREHPLIGPATQAFDHDPKTKWLDFGTGSNTCWLQCSYTLDSGVVITNVSQFVVLARRMAAQNPLLGQAPGLLSNLLAQSSQPLRILRGYALTSANDEPGRDPRDWRLLGSNDGGKTWEVLDVRRNQGFAMRFQRRVFGLVRSAAYRLYRLQIDSVRVPDGLPGGANAVQLAEVEPLYSPSEQHQNVALVVSAQGDNPPIEMADAAFDGDTKTKWLDFAESVEPAKLGINTNKTSWIQWQDLAGADLPVINLRWLQDAPSHTQPQVRIALEGVIVSWEPSARTLGFVDQSGFQAFQLDSDDITVKAGDRVQLCGQPTFEQGRPLLQKATIAQLTQLPTAPDLEAYREINEDFLWAGIEGRVTRVTADGRGVSLGLAPEHGGVELTAKIPRVAVQDFPFFDGCPLLVHGVVQSIRDEQGKRVAGLIWVPDLEHVSLALKPDQDWDRWPQCTARSLCGLRSPFVVGRPVRLVDTVIESTPERIVVGSGGSNQVTVRCRQSEPPPVGELLEAVGFLDGERTAPILDRAKVRPAILQAQPSAQSVSAELDPSKPLTEMRAIHDLIRARAGRGRPVRVQGVITYIDLALGSFYLQQGSCGILVNGQLAAGLAPLLRQEGSFVELEGRISADDPAVEAGGFVRFLGRGTMPTPSRGSLDYLMNGKEINHWVEVQGVVREIEQHRLVLSVTGGRLQIWINDIQRTPDLNLLGASVRIRGVCAPVLNSRNSMLGIRLLVPSMEQLEVLRAPPEDLFSLPTLRIGTLMQLGSDRNGIPLRLVKTTGVVTHHEPGLMFIQDGADGLAVLPREKVVAQAGDQVEVVGFAEPNGFSAKLTQALVRRKGRGALPKASPIDLLESELNSHDATRGEIEAILAGSTTKQFMQVLDLRDQKRDWNFSAFVPTDRGVLPPIPIGSRLRLQGVFKAETDDLPDYGQMVTSFRLYADSPADVTVIDRPSWWSARHTLWVLGGVLAVSVLSLGWVGMLRNQVRQRTSQLHAEVLEHQRTEAHLEAEIIQRKRMQAQVEQTHKELLIASRQAGMAEVATSVLHNVGNVLNSVNVSASMLADGFRKSKASNLAKVAHLLHEHTQDLGPFLTHDDRGKQVPEYLGRLADQLQCERSAGLREIQELTGHIDHIKGIVAMQQSYAKVSGPAELVRVDDLVEEAVRISRHELSRHNIEVRRECDPLLPPISVEKHKVLQILTNLIRNAKLACDESGRENKEITLRTNNGQDTIKIAVSDNGVGIPQENLTRIFSHGFTTRKDGHGFGLHSGALTAKELGGSLLVHSDGPGLGATFTLSLPATLKTTSHD